MTQEPTFGERSADVMKKLFSTWRALIGFLILIAIWMATAGFGVDAAPFIGLNLVLSSIAGLQCFVLLIAARRAEKISARVAEDTERNTESLLSLLKQNTELTKQVQELLNENIKEH